jgi:hypothetical protein
MDILHRSEGFLKEEELVGEFNFFSIEKIDQLWNRPAIEKVL